MAKIKPQSAKAKGRNLQKEIAQYLTELFSLEEGDVVSRPMGSGGVDIMLSPRARQLIPLSIECKSTKAKPSTKAIKQSDYNKYTGTLPIVIWKPPRASALDSQVIINLKDFFSFIKSKGENK